jgi:hypothetical protein
MSPVNITRGDVPSALVDTGLWCDLPRQGRFAFGGNHETIRVHAQLAFVGAQIPRFALVQSRQRKARHRRILRPFVGIHIHQIDHHGNATGQSWHRHFGARQRAGHVLPHGRAIHENPVVLALRHCLANGCSQLTRTEVRDRQGRPREEIGQGAQAGQSRRQASDGQSVAERGQRFAMCKVVRIIG